MTGADDHIPILIVGACTTGLTAACELARRGVRFRIVEKNPAIAQTARAIGLQARTLEIFADLGLENDFYTDGEALHATNIFVDGKLVARKVYPVLDRTFPFVVMLPQYETEALLEARLNALGAAVERSTALVHLEERAGGVRATLQQPNDTLETIHADWVIGCDGAHSTVRHINRQHFPGEADPMTYVIADVVLDADIPRNTMFVAVSQKGVIFGFPLPGGRYFINGDALPDIDRDATPTLAELQRMMDERTGLATTVRDAQWVSTYRMHYRLTPHYRHGRTFLAGDAAHIHSPVGGRGMNSGIQDAQNLAWKLALVVEGKAPAALLDTYESERRPAAAHNLSYTKAATASFTDYMRLPAEERIKLRDMLSRQESLEQQVKAQRFAIEVDRVYPHSLACRQTVRDLSKHETFCGGPQPGAVATGPETLEQGGAQIAFDDVLAGPQFTLLGFVGTNGDGAHAAELAALIGAFSGRFGTLLRAHLVVPSPADNDDGTVLIDPGGRLHARFGCKDAGLYLIRPDGHVGFRNQPPSLVALRTYLDRILS